MRYLTDLNSVRSHRKAHNPSVDREHTMILACRLRMRHGLCVVITQAAHGSRSIGPRGVWTQTPGSWFSNMIRFPGNPINTNVMTLAGKVIEPS